MLKSSKKFFYKGIAFIITFFLLLSLVSFNFSAKALTGSGTISSPYKIGTESELKEFA